MTTTTEIVNERIQITKVTDNGVTYVAASRLSDKYGMGGANIARILELFNVTKRYIGRTSFFDELMAEVVLDGWKDEASKVAYMKAGVSQEFERRLKLQQENQ